MSSFPIALETFNPNSSLNEAVWIHNDKIRETRFVHKLAMVRIYHSHADGLAPRDLLQRKRCARYQRLIGTFGAPACSSSRTKSKALKELTAQDDELASSWRSISSGYKRRCKLALCCRTWLPRYNAFGID